MKEKYKKQKKQYYQKNKEKYKKWYQDYYKKNKEQIKKYNKKYRREHRNNPLSLYHQYKLSTKNRNLIWDLTFEQFKTFWQKPCAYCGDKIETIRLDRIDNLKGYTLNNVVSCCWNCNRMKWSLTKKEFINHCKKIVNYYGRTNNQKKRGTNHATYC